MELKYSCLGEGITYILAKFGTFVCKFVENCSLRLFWGVAGQLWCLILPRWVGSGKDLQQVYLAEGLCSEGGAPPSFIKKKMQGLMRLLQIGCYIFGENNV